MTSIAKHTWVLGEHAIDRVRLVAGIDPAALSVDSHRRLRGPYSGSCVVLNTLVPDAHRERPELVRAHRACILYAAPGLSAVIGEAPATLTFSTPHQDRTRFFGLGYVRAVSQDIVTFLNEYARRRPLTIFFDNAHQADPTEQEFLELLLRRSVPEQLRILVGTTGEALPERLAGALRTYAHRVDTSAAAAAAAAGNQDRPARAYIDSDGTSDDPDLLAAYQRTDAGVRAALHDERADELEANGDWELCLGAIPYHRERGTDRGKACRALSTALEHCLAMGFYAALHDFGERGMAVADPLTQQQEYSHFTAKAATALVSLGFPREAETMFLGLRERYALPRVHMSTSYNLAMLYTRWYAPEHKDHDLAKGFCNNAIALAVQERDPALRAFYTVFQSNGLALVEMHRGNLDRSLRLVTDGIARLDRELSADMYLVHRSQLLHNRARVLLALGRLDECMADFDRLIAIDPNHSEYYLDRGNAARRKGDDTAALADYDRAAELGIPFPEIYYNRGDVRAASGDAAGAIEDFGWVLEMEPDHLDARIGHAELLIEVEELERAAADLVEGLARHPASAELHALAGLAALLTGEDRQARECLDRALALEPELAAARAHRGVLASRRGEHELAVTDLTAALTLLGDDPDLRYQRALAHLALGNSADAEQDLRAVTTLDDGDHVEDARNRLAELAGAGVSPAS